MVNWPAYLGIAISVIGLLFTYVSLNRQQKDRETAQIEREKLKEQKQLEREQAQDLKIQDLATKTDLFWRVVETNVGQLLKSSTHFDKDILLDKLAHRDLTIDEAEKLRGILTDEMQLKGRENGVVAYALIIGRLEQIIHDLKDVKKC